MTITPQTDHPVFEQVAQEHPRVLTMFRCWVHLGVARDLAHEAHQGAWDQNRLDPSDSSAKTYLHDSARASSGIRSAISDVECLLVWVLRMEGVDYPYEWLNTKLAALTQERQEAA